MTAGAAEAGTGRKSPIWPRWVFRITSTVSAIMLFNQSVFAGQFLDGSYGSLLVHRENATYAGLAMLVSAVADFAMVSPRINPFTIHRHIMFTQALRAPRFDWNLFRAPKLRAVDDIENVHVPLSLIHVKNDWLIDHTHSVALYEHANEPKELHIIDIPGNYHADRIFLNASDSIEPLIGDFLARYAPQ